MLRDSPLDVVLVATDLDVARDFYSNKLGLALIDDNPTKEQQCQP